MHYRSNTVNYTLFSGDGFETAMAIFVGDNVYSLCRCIDFDLHATSR